MSRDEIKTEIFKEIDDFSYQALEDVLALVRNIKSQPSDAIFDRELLQKILKEDANLLRRLAQ